MARTLRFASALALRARASALLQGEGSTRRRHENPSSKTPRRTPEPASNRKKINLGLQGGGAHGAFTWGVLDYLLEDGRLDIEGISGASAGAMNAVMLTDGLARGGPEEARKRLAEFWRAVSLDGKLPGLQRAVLDRLLSFTPFQGSPAEPGSARSRAISRPTTSIRSTSIRCAT